MVAGGGNGCNASSFAGGGGRESIIRYPVSVSSDVFVVVGATSNKSSFGLINVFGGGNVNVYTAGVGGSGGNNGFKESGFYFHGDNGKGNTGEYGYAGGGGNSILGSGGYNGSWGPTSGGKGNGYGAGGGGGNTGTPGIVIVEWVE